MLKKPLIQGGCKTIWTASQTNFYDPRCQLASGGDKFCQSRADWWISN